MFAGQKMSPTSHIFSEFKFDTLHGFHLDHFWQHSIATGTLAKRLAVIENCDPYKCDHALMAGILHDTGKLILAANLPRYYRAMLERAEAETLTPLDAEREIFGTTHAEVGAYLFGLWGLPDPIVEAVALHHQPGACVAQEFGALGAVHVANALQHAREATEEHAPLQLDRAYLESLGLMERIPLWQKECLQPAMAGGSHE